MPNCTEFRPPRAKGNSPSRLPQNDLVLVGRESSARVKRFDRGLNAVLILFVLTIPIQAMAQKQAKQKEKQNAFQLPAVIWRDPGDISTLNLLYGAGGKEQKPHDHNRDWSENPHWFEVAAADFYGNGRLPAPDCGRFLMRSNWVAE